MVVTAPAPAQTTPVNAASTSVPTGHFDLSQIGFQQLSDMARRSGAVNVSVDFLDRDHILFTFNPKKLFTRRPECPPSHQDRLVHAAVLEISTGKILRETDWYLHDSRRYLWPLGAGKILLREQNHLSLLDPDLHVTPLWDSPKDLLWIAVTPDGQHIISETADTTASTTKNSKPKTRVLIEFRDATTLAVQRTIRSEKPANIEAESSGFASVIPGFTGRVWLVRFGPSDQQRSNIARVRSHRAPDVLYLSGNTLLIGRDSSSQTGYSVSAFTVTGNRLWRQHWSTHRYDPTLTRSEDGSRFAISTIALSDTRVLTNAVPQDEDSAKEGLEQQIQVFNTASGTPVFSAGVSPVVLNGQNFALSPDGQRLAVLRNTQVEIYDLPQMSAEEQARFTAVKADVPGLYIPPTNSAQQEASEPGFTAADTDAPPQNAEKGIVASNDPANAMPPPDALASAANQTSASDQTPAPSSSPANNTFDASVMTLKSRAQAVALDVVVTDPKGHTVPSLPREAFQIHEDGKPQTITYFDEAKDRGKVPAPAEHDQIAPNIFTNNSPSPSSESITLILYDLLNTPADQQQRAKLELLKFLQNKPKGARFALCALGESLQMVQGFTPDENILIKAAKGQKGSQRYSSMQSQDTQDQQTISWLMQGSARMLFRLGPNFGPMAQNMMDTAGRFEQDEALRRGRDLDLRTWLTMDAFSQLARYLSSIPGRKSLIWLSGSFPLGIFPGVDLRNSDSTTTGYTEQVKQAVNLLAESHIAVYPVDVRGLSVYSMLTPSFSNSTDSTQPTTVSQSPFQPTSESKRLYELGNLSAAGDIGPNLPGGDSPFMQEVMDHGVMDRIAADTGGKAFYNTNGIEQAMSVAMEQETNYYALSYTPSNKKYDGKFRKIKVTLAPDKKKLHVIHRSGYFATDTEAASETAKDATKGFGLAAMQHGSPQAHQVFFAARVVPLGKPRKVEPTATGLVSSTQNGKKKKRQNSQATGPVEVQRYVVDYAVTPAQLRFNATPQGSHHGVINFMITSFSDDGALRSSIVSRTNSDLDAENYRQIVSGGLRLRQQVDVPVQAASMRLGVQDALTGNMGTVEIPLPVNTPPGVEQSLVSAMPEIEPD